MPAPALHLYRGELSYYEERAAGLLASAQDQTEPAAGAFARAGAPLTLQGAKAVLAAEHGLAGWDDLIVAVADLAASPTAFVRAYRAVEAGDPAALAALLDEHPDLVAARGTNGNDLLGMAAATGALRLTELLLARGADPAAANHHGWTALHQAAYAGRRDLAAALLAAGAPVAVSARGHGGTPLIVALFWGQRVTAELLAGRDSAPDNLRVAAGLGRLDRVSELLTESGGPEAGAHRGFYRPHGGFPAWQPGEDRQEVIDEALAWAARNDRTEALALLVKAGARVEADVYRGTALAWAAACNRADAVRALVALGADPNGRSSFGGPDHGRELTALHLAAQGGRLQALDALLELGADPALTDGLHTSTPAGWADEFAQPEAAKRLRARGG